MVSGGQQKAIGGALVTLISVFLMQVLNNQPIDVSTQTLEVSTLAGQIVASLVASGLTYGVVWFRTNVLKLPGGDVAVQQFVKATPNGEPVVVSPETGRPTTVKSPWFVGLLGVGLAVALMGCASVTDATGLTAEQQTCLANQLPAVVKANGEGWGHASVTDRAKVVQEAVRYLVSPEVCNIQNANLAVVDLMVSTALETFADGTKA